MPAKGGSFGNLGLTQPLRPLPDDEDQAAAVADPAAAPAAPQQGATTRGRRSTPQPPAPKPRAATTVRLRPSAAEPLNEAWLAERQATDPKLSYPEFASRIVQLGLAAYEKQQRRSA